LFDPATAGVGSHVITYVVSGVCPGVDTMTITVIQTPNPAITASGPYCVGGSSVNLTAATNGGNWTGTGITNGTTGAFDPATAGAGSHTITYTLYTPCVAIDSTIIVVTASSDATIAQVGPYCT